MDHTLNIKPLWLEEIKLNQTKFALISLVILLVVPFVTIFMTIDVFGSIDLRVNETQCLTVDAYQKMYDNKGNCYIVSGDVNK